ncbi:MAG: PQQ-like beta-propeller repeat protein [Polyangiaceae bacterium]|nr:PQQ-like beta-propeller repeat protein [Polyangiaceae bacterium]
MARSIRWSLAIAASVAACVPLASFALADALDPNMPHTVSVGAPKGAAASDRVDSKRTGLSKTKLPSQPKEVFRRALPSGTSYAPLIDDQGRLTFALTTSLVVRWSSEGKELWRVQLPASTGSSVTVAAPPVILANGNIAVVTSLGELVMISPTGTIRSTTALGVSTSTGVREGGVTPLALDNGGIAIAANRTLIELSADGSVRARATLDEAAAGALLPGPEGTLVTTASGTVYSFKPPGAPRKVGSFGGALRKGAVRADDRTLLAVVDNRRIVALDIPTGSTHTRASAGLLLGGFDGPVAVGKGGTAVTGAYAGLILAFDSTGAEKTRISVDPSSGFGLPDGGAPASSTSPMAPPPYPGGPGFGVLSAFPTVDMRPSPAVLVDADGRIAFARASGRVGIVSPEGNMTLLGERVCNRPGSLQPAGNKKLLVTCDEGTVVLFADP